MIVHYKNLGFSNKETAKVVGESYDRQTLSHQTVKSVWVKYQEKDTIENVWSTEGRPKVTTEKDEKRLKSYFRRNPRKSVSQAKVALELDPSRSTLNKIALENGLKAYRAPNKIKIAERNKAKRLEFAEEYENYSLSFWKRWIFTDESSFALFSPNGRTFVRRKAGNDYDDENNVQFKNQGPSLMVWGAISIDGPGPLVRIDSIVDGEDTLNGARYLKLLQRYVMQNYPYLKDQRYVFQQDNAPSHREKSVQEWFNFKGINLATWPAQSPDLNLIEAIWNEIKFKIRGEIFIDKDQLWKRLKKEWKLISLEYIEELFESMPNRISAIKMANGGNTKY